MPWSVSKSGSGYKVRNKSTGKTYSKKPMSKAKAKKQMAAMYANADESVVRANKLIDSIEDVAECTVRADGSVLHKPPTKSRRREGMHTKLRDTGRMCGQSTVYLTPRSRAWV